MLRSSRFQTSVFLLAIPRRTLLTVSATGVIEWRGDRVVVLGLDRTPDLLEDPPGTLQSPLAGLVFFRYNTATGAHPVQHAKVVARSAGPPLFVALIH